MQFLNSDDLLQAIDNYTLNGITENNPQLIDIAENRAIEEMKSYLNIRFDVVAIFDPLSKNQLVVMYLVDMVLYHLHARISPDHIPDLRKERYQTARTWLEQVADGFAAPLLPHKNPETTTKFPIRYGSTLPKQENFY